MFRSKLFTFFILGSVGIAFLLSIIVPVQARRRIRAPRYIPEETTCTGNHDPVAVIENQNLQIILGQTARLTSNGSFDEDGDSLSYLWAVPVLGIEQDDTIFDFTPIIQDTYLISLTVSDSCSSSIVFTAVEVLAQPTTPPPSQPPSSTEPTFVAVVNSPQDPGKALLTGDISKVTIAVPFVESNNASVDLRSIHFTAGSVNGGNLLDLITRVYLYDGTTLVASRSPTTTNAITFDNIPAGAFTVPASGGKYLTVKVDTAGISDNMGNGKPVKSGSGLLLNVAEKASSFTLVSGGEPLPLERSVGQYKGIQFTLYKSLPVFSKRLLSSNTLINSSGVPLFSFEISASAKGDIAFYKAKFSISTSTATVTDFQLFENPNSSGEVNLTNNSSRAIDRVLIPSSGGRWGLYGVEMLFDTGHDGVASGGELRLISAGTSKIFQLRGSVSNSVAGSTVTTRMHGDHTRNTSYPDKADFGGHNDFVWSDLHFGNSSTTATNTIEWFNGYLVSGLTSTTTAEILARPGATPPPPTPSPDPESDPEPEPFQRSGIRSSRSRR